MFCNITRRKDLVKTLALVIKDGITNVPGIYCYTSNEFEIKFKEPIKNDWTVDGEKLKDEATSVVKKMQKDVGISDEAQDNLVESLVVILNKLIMDREEE